MMLCDNCLSPAPVHWKLLSESDDRLGTDNSVINSSRRFIDKTKIYLKKVVSIEGEIASIDATMPQIAQRHVFLRRRINGLLSMARIPSEIFIEIFRIACQPVDNGYRRAVTPLFIGSICKLWRDVTWSTPLL